MNKRESIAKLLLGINEVFPDYSFSGCSISLYVDALESVDFEKLEMAARKYVLSGRCFPKPVDLIEHASQM